MAILFFYWHISTKFQNLRTVTKQTLKTYYYILPYKLLLKSTRLYILSTSFTMKRFVHYLQLNVLFLQHSVDSLLWTLGSLDNKGLFRIKQLGII